MWTARSLRLQLPGWPLGGNNYNGLSDPRIDEIAAQVGSSKTPVWNRIRKLRDAGVIDRQVAILDPDKLDLASCLFVLIRTARVGALPQNDDAACDFALAVQLGDTAAQFGADSRD